MTAWKSLERHVAKALQGFRIPRGADFSKSLPDVIADASLTIAKSQGCIVAECKYSVRQPWVTKIKKIYDGKPLLMMSGSNGREARYILLCKLEDVRFLGKHNQSLITNIHGIRTPKYIKENIEQARGYVKMIQSDEHARSVLKAASGLSIDPYQPILPIVVLGKKNDSFRLAYCDLNDALSFQHSNDKSKGSL